MGSIYYLYVCHKAAGRGLSSVPKKFWFRPFFSFFVFLFVCFSSSSTSVAGGSGPVMEVLDLAQSVEWNFRVHIDG